MEDFSYPGFPYYNDDYNGFHEFSREFYGDPDLWTVFVTIMIVVGIIVLIGVAINLVVYILRSIGLYRLSVNRGISNPGLAWIPVVGIYRAGSVADDISAQDNSFSSFRHILLAGLIVGNIASAIFNGYYLSSLVNLITGIIGGSRTDGFVPELTMYNGLSHILSLIGLATYVILIICLNKIYQSYRPYSSTAWTVLSVIFPFLQGIFLFLLRNDMPIPQYPEGEGYYPPQNQGFGYPPPQYPPRHVGYYPAPTQPPEQGISPQYPPYPPQQPKPEAAAPAEPLHAPKPDAAAPAEPLPAPKPDAATPETWQIPGSEAPAAPAKSWEQPSSWGVNDNPQNGQ